MDSKYVIPGIMLLLLIGAANIAIGPNTPEKFVYIAVTFNQGGVEYVGYTLEGQTLTFEFKREGDSFTQASMVKIAQTPEKFKNIREVYIKVDTNGDIQYYKAEIFDETDEMVKYYVKEE